MVELDQFQGIYPLVDYKRDASRSEASELQPSKLRNKAVRQRQQKFCSFSLCFLFSFDKVDF